MRPPTRLRLPALFFGVTLAGALLAAGCAGTSGETTARETRDLSLTGFSSHVVRVELFNGEMSVRPGPDGRVAATVAVTGAGATKADAEADRARIVTTLAEETGTVVLRAVYQPDPTNPRNRGASATVTVPAGSSLELVTSNGNVSVAGIAGAIRIRTSNAEVTVDRATAGLDIDTSNGVIGITGSRGQLHLATSNAKIGIAASDAVVTASTSNGDVSFAGTLAAGQQSFETSNAAIALHLEADATFGLDLETSNGKVTVGYPVTTSETAAESRLVGRVGAAPGVTIVARTSNGGITIEPAK